MVTINGRPPAKLCCALRSGDTLWVARGWRAEVYFSCGSSADIVGTGKTVDWLSRQGKQAPKSGVLRKLWNWFLAQIGVRDAPSRAVAAVTQAGDGEPVGYWPCNSMVSLRRPHFAWRALPRAAYEIVILDRGGREIWNSGKVSRCHLAYPADAQVLLTGESYTWHVLAFLGEGCSPLQSRSYWIRVATDEESRSLDRALASLNEDLGHARPPGSAMPQALLLSSKGYVGEAIEVLCSSNGVEPTYEQVQGWLDLLAASKP
jgi:hypothetical protein